VTSLDDHRVAWGRLVAAWVESGEDSPEGGALLRRALEQGVHDLALASPGARGRAGTARTRVRAGVPDAPLDGLVAHLRRVADPEALARSMAVQS
jgi:hypothetical protein